MNEHPKRWIAGIVLCLFVLLAIFLRLQIPAEPSYNGVKLSEWLVGGNSANMQELLSFQTAVRAIGTNALPYVLPMLDARDSAFKLRLMSFLRKQRWVKVSWTPASIKRFRAARAVGALGQRGAIAAPKLVSMLDSKEDAFIAMLALSELGADGMPGLIRALTNQDVNIRRQAPQLIANRGDLAVLPALTNVLSDANDDVKRSAAKAIRELTGLQ